MSTYFLTVLCWILALCTAQAKTFVGDHIDRHTTWRLAGSPYIVAGDIRVLSGVVLEIEAGVEVLFSTDAQMVVEGALRAIGTAGKPIEISGMNKGRWQGFHFRKYTSLEGKTSTDTTASAFEHCIFRGRQYTPTYLIRCDERTVSIINCRIYDCQTAIQTERQGRAFVQDCHIERCYRPLHVRVTSQATMLHTRIKEFALMLVSGTLEFAYNKVERSLARGKYTGFVVWMTGGGVVNLHHNDFRRASQAAFTLYRASRRSTVTLYSNRFRKNYAHLSLSCEQTKKGKFLLQQNLFCQSTVQPILLFDDCYKQADTLQVDSNYFHRYTLEELTAQQAVGMLPPAVYSDSVQFNLRFRALLPPRARRHWQASVRGRE